MDQQNIRPYGAQRYSVDEGAAIIAELDARTKSEGVYNSIDEASAAIEQLGSDKLDKGAYTGNAQDLKDEIDFSNALTGTERYDTLAEVNALPSRSTTVQYIVDNDAANNGYYTWSGSGDVDFNRPLASLDISNNLDPLDTNDPVTGKATSDFIDDTLKNEGKNKYNNTLTQAGFSIQNGTGVIQSGSSDFIWLGYIPAIENQLYTLSRATGNLTRVHFYDSDLNWLGEVAEIALTHIFTTPSNCAFVSSWGVLGSDTLEVFKNSIQLEFGGVKTSYAPYTTFIKPELLKLENITVLKDGEFVYARTSFSDTQDLVQRFNAYSTALFQNNVIGFKGAWLISNTAPNTATAYTTGSVMASQGDDAAPIQYNQSFMGGNHGHSRMRVVTATGHGKTSVDIGSRYTNGASGTWHVLRVVDADTLWMIGTNSGTNAIWNFQSTLSGTLTHTSGGTNTSDIVVGSAVVGQLYPSVRAVEKKVLLDNGIEVLGDGLYSTSELNLVDRYEIVNVSTLIDTLVANVGTAYTDEELDAAFRTGATSVSIDYTYNIQENGAIQVFSPIRNHTEIDLTYFGGVQSALTGSGLLPTRLFYVPKALPITVGAVTYDFRAKQDLTTLPTALIDFDSTVWEDPNSPPERVVQYLRTTGGVVKVGFAMGYDISKGDGQGIIRKDLTDSALVIFTSLKCYPRIIDDKLGNVPQDSYYQTIAYRHFFDASVENTNKGQATNFYWYKSGNEVNVVLDYHTVVSFDKLKLPQDFLGKTIEVVEKSSNITIHSTQVTNGGIVVSASTGIYGHATLKLK